MVTRSASLKLLKIVSILIQPKFSLLFQRMISNNRQNINFCTSFPSPSLKKKNIKQVLWGIAFAFKKYTLL